MRTVRAREAKYWESMKPTSRAGSAIGTLRRAEVMLRHREGMQRKERQELRRNARPVPVVPPS